MLHQHKVHFGHWVYGSINIKAHLLSNSGNEIVQSPVPYATAFYCPWLCLCPRPWFLYRIMRTRETNPTIREQIDPRSVSTDSRSLWLTSACFGQKGPRAEPTNTCALVNPTTSGNYKQCKVFWASIERKLVWSFYFLSKLSLFCDFDFILLCL